MKCPFCSHIEDKVVDSREAKEGDAIRRRRECLKCRRRFTTYEHIEDVLPFVVKKDGRREVFDRNKILGGLKKACEKRPVAMDVLEEIVSRIEKKAQESGEKEIPSSMIGSEVMRELQNLDEVAYVRFASVYREFKDINEFMDELKDLLKERNKK
ncbi:MAG: transcriptional regulator NrdR [Nitrospirae bacterium RIFCSPLOW2_12_42_9]|nr:MAG: transcriptional regulator NrdR [Nitrospirae bacterium GWA2_42_11]OGW54704.1 MAG: transcriptional regulator NrdR [Nitrospirae bacterium RIFCSPLOWO2_02_42_7]OGW59937.1 MAG: transcriptional regulator NrdR [Nitrospirae bacterium RIFCSPHIGHO2_02_FULL_42_12]OGW61182.1 MAG: transcriptional regulator NrdR [Nitrospirae bacterium RIFCSPLOW2_12_42_9]HAS16570.1 transcriptional regulator NrdR [Nitrospiraceae bacterium]